METVKKPNIIDSFIIGAKNGLNIGLYSMIPGIMFAYVVMQLINLTGLIDVVRVVFNPIMAPLGLPGDAATPYLLSFLTTSGGLGVAVTLLKDGIIDISQGAILLTGIMMQGAMIQYIGRVLNVAEIKSKYYSIMFGVTIVNGIIGMVVMRIVLALFYPDL